MLTAIVGINWGDEGKGRMVDLLSEKCDIVARYQGGNNAGHTVVNDKGKFILNLLPSGILRPDVVNVMGNGMVIDLEHLWKEIGRLRAAGIQISPDNLKVSERAVICLPCHVQQDILEEERLGAAKYGSTRRGIGPVYGDKYMKKAFRMCDLFDRAALQGKVHDFAGWKSLTLKGGYGAENVDAEKLYAWLNYYGSRVKAFICDAGAYLEEAAAMGKNILFEAQLGALRDIDFGIYPYTSSSSTLAAYAPIGAGIPGRRMDEVIGVMKAYSTCVGEGPFAAEMDGGEAEKLREAGGEYGAATGRPRRVGPFDAVASAYGVRVQGADKIALTKLDVLSYMERIPVCTGYEIDGERTMVFPAGERLKNAKPVLEYMEGWQSDIGACRKAEALPRAARDYITFLEESVKRPITLVSVGAERDAYVEMK